MRRRLYEASSFRPFSQVQRAADFWENPAEQVPNWAPVILCICNRRCENCSAEQGGNGECTKRLHVLLPWLRIREGTGNGASLSKANGVVLDNIALRAIMFSVGANLTSGRQAFQPRRRHGHPVISTRSQPIRATPSRRIRAQTKKAPARGWSHHPGSALAWVQRYRVWKNQLCQLLAVSFAPMVEQRSRPSVRTSRGLISWVRRNARTKLG